MHSVRVQQTNKKVGDISDPCRGPHEVLPSTLSNCDSGSMGCSACLCGPVRAEVHLQMPAAALKLLEVLLEQHGQVSQGRIVQLLVDPRVPGHQRLARHPRRSRSAAPTEIPELLFGRADQHVVHEERVIGAGADHAYLQPAPRVPSCESVHDVGVPMGGN